MHEARVKREVQGCEGLNLEETVLKLVVPGLLVEYIYSKRIWRGQDQNPQTEDRCESGEHKVILK